MLDCSLNAWLLEINSGLLSALLAALLLVSLLLSLLLVWSLNAWFLEINSGLLSLTLCVRERALTRVCTYVRMYTGQILNLVDCIM
jgi:hypothetical protein